MKISLRQRLLAVALLGVCSCAISLFALGRIITVNNNLRVERARDAVIAELALLQGDTDAGPLRTTVLGMRGGHVADAAAFDAPRADLDELTRRHVAEVVQRAAVKGQVALADWELTSSVLVVGAAPAPAGQLAWIAYSVRPPPYIGLWRFIVASLTLATLLLVATAVGAVVAMRRSAASLNASMAALADDLEAPVARPPVAELGDIADAIAGLASALARAQVEKERLGAELARHDRLAALGRVVTGVAHEVRNPLASIKLRVDLGRARPGTPPELARELAFVSEEVTRLDRLVADLLVVAGRRSGPRIETALGALVTRRTALLQPWAEERGVQLEVRGDASAPVDADAVSRAVDNLVRNAVEASPKGSAVAIEVLVGEGAARVRVVDHGPGVDVARAHELFEPFFTTKPDGTGLGLALSRAIAGAHGGSLTYDRGGGRTSFELSFPRAHA